jgi:hypothetical protein
MYFIAIAGSSNGRTTDSESFYLGSNPGPAARSGSGELPEAGTKMYLRPGFERRNIKF